MILVLANQAKNTRDAVVLNAAGLIEIIVDGCIWLKVTDLGGDVVPFLEGSNRPKGASRRRPGN